jgi:hypothetical protein
MLKPLCFDLHLVTKTGRLFPESVEDDRKIAYHGTCSVYTEAIERGGLLPRFPIYDFDEIKKIAASLPAEQKQLAVSLMDYAENKGTRLSLAPTSLEAARYAYNVGGQISAQLRRALGKAEYKSESIAMCLKGLESAIPTVYAVDLQRLLKGPVTNDPGSRNIYVGEQIAPELLIARTDMPMQKPFILTERIHNGPTYEKLLPVRGTLVNILFEKSRAEEASNVS